ncbi:MAG: APC family permease [Solirubrobacterales bacterium]
MSTTEQQPPGEFSASSKGLFTRRSSGLVREVGAFDTMLYGINAVAIGYIVFIVSVWALYPGASMSLATLITIGAAVAVGITYALLSAAYPRSGGEYVFVSRILNPLVGFVVGFSQTFWQAFYVGINGAFVAKFAFAPTCAILGVQTGANWLTDLGEFFGEEKWGIFLGGTLCVVVFGAILLRGSKLFFKVQRWGLFIALASLAVTIVVLILGTTGALDFKQNFDSLGGAGSYDGVVNGAVKEGIQTSPAFNFGQTLDFMIWPAFSILFTVLSVSFGGEIRNVKRSQLIGIPGSMMIGGGLMILMMIFAQGAFGSEFLRAAGVSAEFPIAAPPFLNVLAAITANSPVMTVIMSLWMLILLPYALGVGIIYSSRSMLAWSIDGMAPKALSNVSRNHVPVNAVLAVLVVAEACLALYAFTDLLAILSGLIAFGIVFIAVTLAGLLFPFLKRSTFEASASAMRFMGVPVISIASAIGLIFVCFVTYRAFVDDVFAANTNTSIRMTFIVIGVSVVWYLVASAIQRRRGADLSRRYKEIPVE